MWRGLTSASDRSKVQPHYTLQAADSSTQAADSSTSSGPRRAIQAMSRSILIALALVLGVSPALFTQATASSAGIVQEASGAVLPGVTLEASSPGLIEKVRTVITYAAGQYKIEQLRGGVYTVTFTLSGFSTLRREG